jgi:hypothetical protein
MGWSNVKEHIFFGRRGNFMLQRWTIEGCKIGQVVQIILLWSILTFIGTSEKEQGEWWWIRRGQLALIAKVIRPLLAIGRMK